MKKTLKYLFPLFTFSYPALVYAIPDQPDDFLSLSLEDLLNVKVITSSKYSEKSIDSPTNIEVITAKQINERGYKNVEDILRNLPGVDLNEYSSIRGFNLITMRGSKNNNKFLILKDGVRISAAAGGTTTISQNYPLYMAQRVEVITGPAAVTYGADAFSGVINIISYEQGDVAQTNNGGEVSIAVGDSHYLNSHIQYNHTFDNDIYLNLGMQGYYSQELDFDQQYPELYPTSNTDYVFKNTDEFQFFADAVINDYFSLGVFHSKITYSSDVTVKANISSFDHTIIENSTSSIYAKFDYSITENLHSNTLFTYQYLSLGNGTSFNNIFTNYQKLYKYGRTANYSLNQDFTYKLNTEHLLSGGLLYSYIDLIPPGPDLPSPYNVEKDPDEQDYFYPNTELRIEFFQQRDENIGAYIQDNWQLNEQWRQVTGIRYDHHTMYGDTVNPRSTTIYQVNQHNIFKLIYAHSFLAPPPGEAFSSFGSFSGEQNEQGEWLSSPYAPFRVPNENLKPETLKSLELNYQHWFNDHNNIKMASYYNKIKDVIVDSYDEVAQQKIAGAMLLETTSVTNSGESTTYGVDVSSNFSFSFENSQIDYWLAASYLDGYLVEQNIKTDLPMSSRVKLKAGFTFSYQDESQNYYIISPTIRWTSGLTNYNLDEQSNDTRTALPSFLVMDLHSQVNLSDNLAVKLTINNLLDRKHYHGAAGSLFLTHGKSPQPGRLVYLTLSYSF